MRYGYTLMTEQAGPRHLVRCAASAESVGFDFEVCSDHFSPWLREQGHAPYAWSVLGAVTQCTESVELMTYVTCPLLRYHPAVVAQKAATMQLLSEGRFTLGLGAGENLNEHIVGGTWPAVNIRHEMLDEAVEIIRALFDGGHVDYRGDHYRVDSAKLWDLPEQRVPLGVAVSGSQSITRYAPVADAMISVEPNGEFAAEWDAKSQAPPTRKIGQLPVSWGSDEREAIRRARAQFRWFAGGWKVNAELPGTDAFAAATRYVTEEDIAEAIPCGRKPEPIVAKAEAFRQAGFTDLALVQIGGESQDEFFGFAQDELLPALRETS